MPSTRIASNLENAKQEFIKLIFDPDYFQNIIELPKGTMQLVASAFSESLGMNANEEKHSSESVGQDKLPLAQFVQMHIMATHTMMLFVTDESIKSELLLYRIELLVDALAIIFTNYYANKVGADDNLEEFYENLKECLFLSTLVSFEKETVKKHSRDMYLVGGYDNKFSLSTLDIALKHNFEIYEATLRAWQPSPNELNKQLQEAKHFFAEIRAEYEKNTVPNKSITSLAISGLASIAVVATTWFLDGGLISLVGIPFGFGVDKWFLEAKANRVLAPETNAHYLGRVDYYTTKAEALLRGKDKEDLKKVMAIKTKMKPGLIVKLAVTCHHKVIDALHWQQLVLNSKAKTTFAKQEKTLSIYGLNYSNSTVDLAANYQAAQDIYRKTTQKKVKVDADNTSTKEGKKEIVNTGTSTTKIVYKLSKRQKNNGLLVCANPSKAFFVYGDYKDIITTNINKTQNGTFNKVQDGIFDDGFAAKVGEFGGFKYMANLKRYELKLFDGTRR